MKNFVTPHEHPSSFDSGSTQIAMVEREVELGTGYGTITDHGTMGGCIDWYDLCRKNGIKPILGLEAYFRDDECPLLDKAGLVQPLIDERKQEIIKDRSTIEYLKYFHLTLHFLDQDAYLAGVRLLSKAELHNREKHGSEGKPIFTWRDVEELGTHNVTVGSSCLIGMVSRHLLVGRPDLAEQYYLKLKSCFKPGNFYAELLPQDCSRNWENKVVIALDNGEIVKLNEDRKILVDGQRIKMKDLLRRTITPGKLTLDGTFYYSALTKIEKKISSVELRKGFFQNEPTEECPDGDMQLVCNKFVLGLATKYGDPVLISDDSHFARSTDKLAQDVRLNHDGKEGFRFWGNYHRMDSAEATEYFTARMGIPSEQIEQWVENSYIWASRFDAFELKFGLQLPNKFYEQHGDPLGYTMSLIRQHGRFDINDPIMRKRLTTEIKMLTENGTVNLLPYFFPLEEAVNQYQANGLLTGPGRGSAAGMLLTYLMGITHVNPLKYNLSMERFITEDRIKAGTLPDIDQDLEDREFLVGPDGRSGWLFGRFGQNYVAQISTHTNLRLKSSIKDVHRARGTLYEDVERICKRLPNPPQGIDDYDWIFGKIDDDGQVSEGVPGILDNPALAEYVQNYPEEWAIVQKLLGIPRQASKHACAFVISPTPIADFIPMTVIGGVPVTQYTAKSVERCGGVKTDFLVVNSLKDIRMCLDMIRERHAGEPTTEATRSLPTVRRLPFKGQVLDIWDLPEDQEVFRDICDGRTETVFQLNTESAIQYLRLFRDPTGQHLIRSIEDIAAFTSLDRPGPLDYQVGPDRNMLHEFVSRKKGTIDTTSQAFSQYLLDALPETRGVLVYQEQLQKVVQDVGGFDPLEANNFRICVGKKKKVELMEMRPKFIAGATPKIGEEEATKIFDMMVTFGQYGFNKSHAVSYSVTAYACAFLKHHYPLEWWCAVLRNAAKSEIYGKFWRFCRHLVIPPDINKSKNEFTIEGNYIRSPINLMDGVGPATLEELTRNAPYRDIRDLITRVNRRVVNRRVLLKLLISGAMDSLFDPINTTIEQKHQEYQQARADLLKEKIESLPAHLDHMLDLQRYCVRKDIIPTYSCWQTPGEKPFLVMFMTFAPMDALSANYGVTIRTNSEGVRRVEIDLGHDRQYRMVSPEEFERLIADTSQAVQIAVPAYVVEEDRFSYAGGTREALKLTIDLDGVVSQMVMWPRRHGDSEQIPWSFDHTLKGSIALLCLSRWKEGRDFAIDNIQWICGMPEEIDKKEGSE